MIQTRSSYIATTTVMRRWNNRSHEHCSSRKITATITHCVHIPSIVRNISNLVVNHVLTLSQLVQQCNLVFRTGSLQSDIISFASSSHVQRLTSVIERIYQDCPPAHASPSATSTITVVSEPTLPPFVSTPTPARPAALLRCIRIRVKVLNTNFGILLLNRSHYLRLSKASRRGDMHRRR